MAVLEENNVCLRITFELIKIEQNRKHHRVLLVETIRNIYGLTPKGQDQDLTLGHMTSKFKLGQIG